LKTIITKALISAFLFWAAWPPNDYFFLTFVALSPILNVYLTKSRNLSSRKLYMCGFLALFFFNTSVTFWIYELTNKAFLIHIFNALLFSTSVLLFQFILSKHHRYIGYIYFVLAWIVLEYLHLNWELAYPLLTLGNSLAKFPLLIQWYEFTGVLGGSVWILLVNVIVCELLFSRFCSKRELNIKLVLLALVIVIPIAISVTLFKIYKERGIIVSVSVLNSNIDCRIEKYSMSADSLISRYISIQKPSKKSELIVWPETAIPNGGLANQITRNMGFSQIKNSLLNDSVCLITGAIIYENAGLTPKRVRGLFYHPQFNTWLSTHNSIVKLQRNEEAVLVKSKKRLVAFEEFSPYPEILQMVSNINKSLGGFEFSEAINSCESFSTHKVSVLPLICYESLFGADMRNCITEVPQIITISLNEGWYHDYTGASQFLYYSCLRAIEFRRSVARSSNGGISGFVSQRGELLNYNKKLDEPGYLTYDLLASGSRTFYARHGDYLGVVSIILIIALSLALIIAFAYKKLLRNSLPF